MLSAGIFGGLGVEGGPTPQLTEKSKVLSEPACLAIVPLVPSLIVLWLPVLACQSTKSARLTHSIPASATDTDALFGFAIWLVSVSTLVPFEGSALLAAGLITKVPLWISGTICFTYSPSSSQLSPLLAYRLCCRNRFCTLRLPSAGGNGLAVGLGTTLVGSTGKSSPTARFFSARRSCSTVMGSTASAPA